VLVEVITVGDIICDSGQAGDSGVFLAETKLGVGKEVVLGYKRC
jgi:hypothetical protein